MQINNFDLLINIFDLLINICDLLIDFGRSFNHKLIKINQLQSKIDRIYIEIVIVDSIVILESDLYHNCRPNSLESKFESSTIQFVVPNCLSLDVTAPYVPVMLNRTIFFGIDYISLLLIRRNKL